MRRLFLSAIALLGLAAAPVHAAPISLFSGSQYSEPSQVLATVNALIQQINTNVGSAGAGTVASAITIPTVANAINALSVTAGATTVAPILSVGSSQNATADTNIGIVLAGRGSGRACLGGTTCANSSASFVTTASAVNGFIATGGATGTAPSFVTGGTSVDTNVGMFVAGAGTGVVYLGGTTTTLAGLQIAQPASRVNGFVLTPGATGVVPSIVVGGATVDTNIGMFLAGNGTGPVYIGGTSTTLAGLQVLQVASRVNGIVVTPAATTVVPSIAIGGAGADANRNLSVAAAGTGIVALGQAISTCSGTTTATCQGQRFIASVTGLTTAAAGVESAAMTVTNASVVSASSTVVCNVNIYAGTGLPLVGRVTPGTGTVSFVIVNVAGSGSLNATVPVHCTVTG